MIPFPEFLFRGIGTIRVGGVNTPPTVRAHTPEDDGRGASSGPGPGCVVVKSVGCGGERTPYAGIHPAAVHAPTLGRKAT